MDFSKLKQTAKQQKAALAKRERNLTLKPGSQRIVLMPGWSPEQREVFFHAYGAHYVKNAAGEVQAFLPCPNASFGEPCPVCDAVATAIKNSPSDEMTEMLKEAKSGKRFLINVLALDGEEPNTPKTLEVPKVVFENIVGLMEDWGEAIFDPENPTIISIEKTGKGLGTRYTVQVSPKKHKLPAAALSQIPNLEEAVRAYSDEDIKRALGAVHAAAGLLPAADVPRTASTAPRLAHSRPADVEDAKPAVKPAAPSLDDDLDSLLGDDLELAA
jgi:hypothetical protein